MNAVLEAGALLIQAKAALTHGEWLRLIRDMLPFGPRTAQRLTVVATDTRLSNTTHGSHLPSSWRTLYEITRLTDDQFKLALELRIIRPDMERSALGIFKKQKRAEEIEAQVQELAAARPCAPLGLFHVIVIDPPWPYGDGVTQSNYDPAGHRASNPYPEMPLEGIADIELPAADDCVLWLWTTHRFMRHSFPLLDAWGFTDRQILTWAKDRMGLGRWLRSQTEFCIMATKGEPALNLTDQTTLLHGPMREHSRKPDEFYVMVDSLCVGRKLDYFSRESRAGWEQYGNDVERFSRDVVGCGMKSSWRAA